ncbi:hypothetical protein DFP73DRAFT_509954 [Morchella snyderi]|nr:hypothetical protein DFP73DRAFT_509954 [Morchella snyderi]
MRADMVFAMDTEGPSPLPHSQFTPPQDSTIKRLMRNNRPEKALDISSMDRHELENAVTTAYSRLSEKELHILLLLRSLPTCGDPQELAFRLAVHDLSRRTDLAHQQTTSFTPPLSTASSFNKRPWENDNTNTNTNTNTLNTNTNSTPSLGTTTYDDDVDMAQLVSLDSLAESTSLSTVPTYPPLPPELWADIFEIMNDWELSVALGIRTNLRRSVDWEHNGTRLDYAILSGSVAYVASFLSSRPGEVFTKFGAKAMVRFGYLDLLTFFHERFPKEFMKVYSEPTLKIPTLASHFARTEVLSWWLAASDPKKLNALPRDYDEEPLNDASREGHIHVLQWWKSSGLPLRYGLVMDVASSFGHLDVLEWWKNSGLSLNYHNALKGASYHGKVEVLEWWKRSGLRLVYDKEVLVEATKFNRADILEWWSRSGLRVEYCVCDIEAALEDAIGGGKQAREWWFQRGCRFNVPVNEWMMYKTL